jgi:hypothetical protein
MWLTYGVDTDNALIAISDVPSGKTYLRCPYCGGPLTAKKGQIIGHHFAHTGETCRAVERDDGAVALPLYDNFNLQLSGKELQTLHKQWAWYGANGQSLDLNHFDRMALRLAQRGVITWNRHRSYGSGGYEFTKLGSSYFFRENIRQARSGILAHSDALHALPLGSFLACMFTCLRSLVRESLSENVYVKFSTTAHSSEAPLLRSRSRRSAFYRLNRVVPGGLALLPNIW